MATFIKCLLLCLFALVIFAEGYFPSRILYWSTYVVMFALIPLWWFAAYWISTKKVKAFLNEEFDTSFFVGMVAENVNDDLIRGRLCFTEKEVQLVVKDGKTCKVAWKESIDNITYTESGTVVGWRKGFSLYTNEGKISFVTKNAKEIVRIFNKQ